MENTVECARKKAREGAFQSNDSKTDGDSNNEQKMEASRAHVQGEARDEINRA